MQDQQLGSACRLIRIRRGWRQSDLASAAQVSRMAVWRLEHGRIDDLAVGKLRRLAGALDGRIDLVLRWRGGELDRLISGGHSAMHEAVAAILRRLGWETIPELTFSIYGERGAIDILAWHAATRTLLVVELKTEIVDVQDLVGSVDRYRRLAPRLGRERGWDPVRVACWVVIAEGRTNRRRLSEHATVLRGAFPHDGRTVSRWLRAPAAELSALSFLPRSSQESLKRTPTPVKRVRLPASRSDREHPAGRSARNRS